MVWPSIASCQRVNVFDISANNLETLVLKHAVQDAIRDQMRIVRTVDLDSLWVSEGDQPHDHR